jgi:hypothetical protein
VIGVGAVWGWLRIIGSVLPWEVSSVLFSSIAVCQCMDIVWLTAVGDVVDIPTY